MKLRALASFLFLFLSFVVFTSLQSSPADQFDIAWLRKVYSSGDKSLWPAPHLADSVKNNGRFEDIGALKDVEFPDYNPYSEAKVELGKLLFFDPRLSSSKQIACASCHDSEIGWGDGRRVSYGHNREQGRRNSMTLLNVGHAESLFWDGRATSLEDQVEHPIFDEVEMNFHINFAVKRIADIPGYQQYFEEAFGDNTVSTERISYAIATYERTIKGRTSRFDQFVNGKSDRLTDQEVLGMHLFRTKARCINCHNTDYFSDNQFHNTGLTYYGRKFEDLGRYEVTGKAEDVGRFKTATLRETGRTGPFMHNGLFPHLDGVINLYNAGMPQPKRKEHQKNDSLFPTTSKLVEPLHLTEEEQEALEAFVLTLETTIYRVDPPKLPMN